MMIEGSRRVFDFCLLFLIALVWRRYARHVAVMDEQMGRFLVSRAQCLHDSDREYITTVITSIYGSRAGFEEHVRHELREHVREVVGVGFRFYSSYALALRISLPLLIKGLYSSFYFPNASVVSSDNSRGKGAGKGAGVGAGKGGTGGKQEQGAGAGAGAGAGTGKGAGAGRGAGGGSGGGGGGGAPVSTSPRFTYDTLKSMGVVLFEWMFAEHTIVMFTTMMVSRWCPSSCNATWIMDAGLSFFVVAATLAFCEGTAYIIKSLILMPDMLLHNFWFPETLIAKILFTLCVGVSDRIHSFWTRRSSPTIASLRNSPDSPGTHSRLIPDSPQTHSTVEPQDSDVTIESSVEDEDLRATLGQRAKVTLIGYSSSGRGIETPESVMKLKL